MSQNEFHVYKVKQASSHRLWIEAEGSGVKGWVTPDRLIPFEQAVEFYTNLIRANPTSADYYYSRGLAWQDREEYDNAIADYGEAIRLDPGDADAYYNRGTAWYEKKEYGKALADYGEAIRLDPGGADAYNNRGTAWETKKEYDKAMADYNDAIRLDPGYADAYINRAWLWATAPNEKVRDGKRAVESATRACELDGWKSADDLDTLAAAYAEAGDFKAAVKWQEKAVELSGEGDAKGRSEYLERLELYRGGKPYRQVAGS